MREVARRSDSHPTEHARLRSESERALSWRRVGGGRDPPPPLCAALGGRRSERLHRPGMS
eukprot:9573197-Alexandrium_andersonii.AAC.1